jgi:hypothetical protein
MMVVDGSMSPASGDEPPVHRKGRRTGNQERDRKAAPEEAGAHPGVHRPGDQEHDAVVHDFHNSNGDRVGGERKPDSRPKGEACA